MKEFSSCFNVLILHSFPSFCSINMSVSVLIVFPKPWRNYAQVFITSPLLYIFSSFPVDPTQFPRKEIPKRPKDPRPSTLALLLAEYNRRSANPFFGYSKFNGEVSCLSCWVMSFIVGPKVICIAPLATVVLTTMQQIHCILSFVFEYDVMCKPFILLYLALLASFSGHSQILPGIYIFLFCFWDKIWPWHRNEMMTLQHVWILLLVYISRAIVWLLLIYVGSIWLSGTADSSHLASSLATFPVHPT